jgi:1-phosphofructokinase/tagatose 6-phosphate kinase
MGGLLWSLANGSTAKRALATAVAAGAANAAQPVAGMVDREVVTALADRVLGEIKEEGE